MEVQSRCSGEYYFSVSFLELWKAKINSDPGSSEETISSTGDQLGHLSKVGKCTISLYGSSMYERALHTHKKQCVALSHNFKVAVAHTRL